MGRIWADCGRVCTHAANSYETSLTYSEREREQVLPYLYGTAGPEISYQIGFRRCETARSPLLARPTRTVS